MNFFRFLSANSLQNEKGMFGSYFLLLLLYWLITNRLKGEYRNLLYKSVQMLRILNDKSNLTFYKPPIIDQLYFNYGNSTLFPIISLHIH